MYNFCDKLTFGNFDRFALVKYYSCWFVHLEGYFIKDMFSKTNRKGSEMCKAQCVTGVKHIYIYINHKFGSGCRIFYTYVSALNQTS